jgi:hypothetical protein
VGGVLSNVIAVAVTVLAGPLFVAVSVTLLAVRLGCSVPSTVQVS